MTRTTGTLLGFLCIGLSLSTLFGCPKNVPVKPLPPAIDGSACRTAVVIKSEDVCADMFTPGGLACVRCGGGDGCVSTESMIYCIVGHVCAADLLCSKVTAPPTHR